MKIVCRKNGEVVMIGNVNNDFLTTVEVADDDRAFQGYHMTYKDGKVIYESTPMIDKQQLKDDIEKATTIKQLKDIITKLL